MTYGPENELASKVVTPRHFQNFIKRLRKRGHKIRYLAVGEYGSLKGRAHFHALLFFQGQAPQIPHKQNANLPDLWPHGHIFADWAVTDPHIRYVCKYLMEPQKKGKGWFSVSKNPALGAGFFTNAR